MSRPVGVVVVDDSALMREMIAGILSEDPAIHVLATASDAFDAREKIKQHNPDVVTLDVEMPRMDGISFLEKIMTLRPTPVVMVSSVTQKGARATMKALELGAVDIVPKQSSRSVDMAKFAPELQQKVKIAAKAQVSAYVKQPKKAATPSQSARFHPKTVIAIGASTGGVEAIREVVQHFPANAPPCVITQHMPIGFTSTFSERLNSLCAGTVVEAKSQTALKPGHIYIAPGNRHLTLNPFGPQLKIRLTDSELVSGHRPSVDVMMKSLAEQTSHRIVATILTGMGRDGAEGLLAVREAGGTTFGQDESSSVVYGMPKVAQELGAVETQYSLSSMADALLGACKEGGAS